MKKGLLIIPFLFSILWLSTAQTIDSNSEAKLVPSVGMIGEYESAFASLAVENPGILLGVCGNDMDIAYEKWTNMLVAMEDYAESIAYDIDGLKTYFYIFWNRDGTVKHLAFYPKANSRNIPVEELRAFFKGFVKEYHMTIVASEGYSHYGSATFPTHARPEYRVKRD
jgi:hypothetical protein